MSLSIDHINRYVSNVDKFIDFYQEVLDYKLIGLGIKQSGNKYAILQGIGHEMFISEKDNFKPINENLRHIGYSVDNTDQFLEKLKLKGYATEEQQVIIKQYSRQLYIKDPDGMELDLIEWTDKQGFYNNLKKDREE
ncbi:MAG: glyoxalase/bleomycin resistance/dioxygenase family protein [Clostridia bacterium]|nr:glyoxalase/bleomycin resistance/dioxygenase family protein [Clostridia bacterium]